MAGFKPHHRSLSSLAASAQPAFMRGPCRVYIPSFLPSPPSLPSIPFFSPYLTMWTLALYLLIYQTSSIPHALLQAGTVWARYRYCSCRFHTSYSFLCVNINPMFGSQSSSNTHTTTRSPPTYQKYQPQHASEPHAFSLCLPFTGVSSC
jgi:hypothetical protein